MNRVSCEFPSYALKTQTKVLILLPKNRPSPFDMGTASVFSAYPTLYLLHGAFEDGQSWLYHTDLADLVDRLGLAVVLPDAGNSFYLDISDGIGYYTYITEELPGYLQQILPLSRKREENFIGGFSMGGYGAFYAALRKPEQYGKAFSMSGALDVTLSAGFVKVCGGALPELLQNKKALTGSRYDLLTLAEQADPAKLPELLITCGEQDFFLQSSRRFVQKAQQLNLPFQYVPSPGDHTWAYWRKCLPECLEWLLKDAAVSGD